MILKHISTALLFGLPVCGITQTTSSIIDYNNVSAQINNSGILFNDIATTAAAYEVPKTNNGTGPKMIYSSTFWFGGLDVNGQVHVAGNRFFNDGPDLYPGPIANNYNSASYHNTYNNIWRVTKNEVINHVNNYMQPGYIPSPSISTWPGNGNTSNGEAAQLAPYVDVNNNNTYDPINGDYPDIRGDEAQFFIVNDAAGPHQTSGGNTMKLEIHFMLYQYATNNYLNNTTFINLHVFNRSQTTYHNFKTACYVDHDIGSSQDDYVGCTPEHNMIIGYNGDNDDNSGGGIQFGQNPPALGVKLLNHTMGVAGYYNNAGGILGDPDSDPEFWNFMNARWGDGSHFTYGGDGYGGLVNTNYLYPDNPSDPNGWSEPTTNNVPADRRMYMVANQVNAFSPGQSICYDFAVIYSRIGDYLQNVNDLYNIAGNIQAFYNGQNYTSCQSNFLSVNESAFDKEIILYPNPTQSQFTVNMDGVFDITLFDISGQQVFEQRSLNRNTIIETDLSEGIYIVAIRQDGITYNKKLIVE